MKLYVAGPMRGYPRFNFDAFDEATAQLRAAGYEVVSPAEEDVKLGFDPSGIEDFSLADYQDAMRRDVEIVLGVDGIALLAGWELSEGAHVEVTVAGAIGVPYHSVARWLEEAHIRQPQEA